MSGEEKEIKVKVLDKLSCDAVKNVITRTLGVKFGQSRKDSDVYYDLQDDFFFKHNQALRIRNDRELAYKALFYLPKKKPTPWFVLEKELRLPVKRDDLAQLLAATGTLRLDGNVPASMDLETLLTVLRQLKLVPRIKIEKTRWITKGDGYDIAVDQVGKLGMFIEIEAQHDHLLDETISKLPLRHEEIRHGYVELYVREVLKKPVPNFKERFAKNPSWNFLKGQKELVQNIIKSQSHSNV